MRTDARNDLLVWVDCEMTGLDTSVDEIIEIAVIVTDFDLTIHDDGVQIVVRPSDAARDNMGEFVTNMHEKSGLLAELDGGVTLREAEAEALAYIKHHQPVARKSPLAGNTIGTDRMFIAKDMPLIDEHLHYRSIDVSSIKELSKRWFPRAYMHAPVKGGGHRALADIRESIRELQYYREAVFTAEPGPTSDEAKAIAAQVTSSFGQIV